MAHLSRLQDRLQTHAIQASARRQVILCSPFDVIVDLQMTAFPPVTAGRCVLPAFLKHVRICQGKLDLAVSIAKRAGTAIFDKGKEAATLIKRQMSSLELILLLLCCSSSVVKDIEKKLSSRSSEVSQLSRLKIVYYYFFD